MNSVPEAVFFTVVGALTAAWLWRELPLQYVITILVIASAVSALGCFLAERTCWWLPLIVLNSRGVSRYVLRRWQDRPYYGWWLIGLTCVLSTVLVRHWSAPLLALLMQLAATPWLIKRRPGNSPSYLPILMLAMIAVGGLLGFFVLP
ncbi:MAG TPA: hypothetical protein VJ063_13520 [Verrucomicrobiae bacterium]|nr:hypothetical protein [Verrucomicrobiae bacterium]